MSLPVFVFGLAEVIATRNDKQLVIGYRINEAVSLVYAPRPVAAKAVFQWFRLADPREGISLGIFDQIIDTFERFSVLRLPVDVVVPGLIRELQVAHLVVPQRQGVLLVPDAALDRNAPERWILPSEPRLLASSASEQSP